MATRTPTTRRRGRREDAAPRGKYETNPERIKLILETLDRLYDATNGDICDKFSSTDELRELAERVRLPFMAIQVTPYGMAEITEADVDEYNAWRTAAGAREGGAR